MALGSVNARNAILNNSLAGTDAPANLYLALYVGDPTAGGVEVTGTGYARAAIPKATGWAAATGGTKANAVALTFTSSGATWSSGNAITHGALVSTASGAGDVWDTGMLGASFTVTAATTITFAIGALSVSEA